MRKTKNESCWPFRLASEITATRKFWREAAVASLRQFRKTNNYSDWENYQNAKTLAKAGQ